MPNLANTLPDKKFPIEREGITEENYSFFKYRICDKIIIRKICFVFLIVFCISDCSLVFSQNSDFKVSIPVREDLEIDNFLVGKKHYFFIAKSDNFSELIVVDKETHSLWTQNFQDTLIEMFNKDSYVYLLPYNIARVYKVDLNDRELTNFEISTIKEWLSLKSPLIDELFKYYLSVRTSYFDTSVPEIQEFLRSSLPFRYSFYANDSCLYQCLSYLFLLKIDKDNHVESRSLRIGENIFFSKWISATSDVIWFKPNEKQILYRNDNWLFFEDFVTKEIKTINFNNMQFIGFDESNNKLLIAYYIDEQIIIREVSMKEFVKFNQ